MAYANERVSGHGRVSPYEDSEEGRARFIKHDPPSANKRDINRNAMKGALSWNVVSREGWCQKRWRRRPAERSCSLPRSSRHLDLCTSWMKCGRPCAVQCRIVVEGKGERCGRWCSPCGRWWRKEAVSHLRQQRSWCLVPGLYTMHK